MRSIFFLKSHIAKQGGLEKQTLRLANSFVERGHPVTLLTTGPTPDLPGIEMISHSLSSKMSFRKIEEFDRFCQRFPKKDALVFGFDRNGFQTHLRAGNGSHASYLQKRKKIDSFVKSFSTSFNPLHRTILKLEKEAFEHKELEVLFTNSHMVKNEILEFYNTDPHKIHVIHNGVEWKEMESDFENWTLQKKKWTEVFKLDPSIFHFLFIGHGFKRKGLELLLKALSSLPSRDFHLSVIGHDKHMDTYIHLRDKLHLTRQVRFFGPQKDVRPFYQLADALIIPSFYDPCANVTIEALAMGLLVISSKYNGGHEILTKENGIIIDDLFSLDSIRVALEKALLRPKTWIHSQKIRSSVSHLDFSNQLKAYLSLCLPTS